jgi:hypothetical protein
MVSKLNVGLDVQSAVNQGAGSPTLKGVVRTNVVLRAMGSIPVWR